MSGTWYARMLVGTAACALLLVPAAPAAAQSSGTTRSHAGFWLSGGLGGGLNDGGDGGGAAYVRMGGTLSQHVVIGGEAIGWNRDAGGINVSRGNAMFDVLLYPSTSAGGFLKAGIGFASVESSTDLVDVSLVADNEGAGAVLGAGWDLQLGDGNLYLTPNFDILLQGFDSLDRVNALYLFTLGIGFH